MKQSKIPISAGSDEAPLSFSHFIRLATKHTAIGLVALFGASLLATVLWGIATLFTSYQFEPLLIWKIVGFFFVLYVPVLWVATIFVGCLVMIPVEVWRLIQLLTRTNPKNTAPGGGLWDRSMDDLDRQKPLVRRPRTQTPS